MTAEQAINNGPMIMWHHPDDTRRSPPSASEVDCSQAIEALKPWLAHALEGGSSLSQATRVSAVTVQGFSPQMISGRLCAKSPISQTATPTPSGQTQ